MLFYTFFIIYELLPCNHTEIYIIFLDTNLLKYRTPCSAAEAESTRKNSKLPVYESYNKLFHRILSTCLKLHIPANLQTYPSQPKHLLITLNILANEYFKSGRHSWVTFSTISTLTYPSQATYLLNNTAYLIILNIFTNEYFKSERKKPDC